MRNQQNSACAAQRPHSGACRISGPARCVAHWGRGRYVCNADVLDRHLLRVELTVWCGSRFLRVVLDLASHDLACNFVYMQLSDSTSFDKGICLAAKGLVVGAAQGGSTCVPRGPQTASDCGPDLDETAQHDGVVFALAGTADSRNRETTLPVSRAGA
jgi:hypothetical protein